MFDLAAVHCGLALVYQARRLRDRAELPMNVFRIAAAAAGPKLPCQTATMP